MMLHRRKSVSSRRRGVATVEAAVLLPMLTILVLGASELGSCIHCSQVLNNAARQGARAAVYVGNSNAEVEAAVRNALDDSMGLDPDAVDVRISMLSPEGQEQYQVRNLSENEQGGAIRVTVSVDYGLIGSATNLLGLQAGRLSSYAVMRRQR